MLRRRLNEGFTKSRRATKIVVGSDSQGGSDRGALVVEVRIRLGTGIARFASAPTLTLELPSGATVDDLYERLAASNPELGAALQSAVPIVSGVHVERDEALAPGEEVALLAPMSGG